MIARFAMTSMSDPEFLLSLPNLQMIAVKLQKIIVQPKNQ